MDQPIYGRVLGSVARAADAVFLDPSLRNE